MLRDTEISEDGLHDGRVGEEREGAHLPVATRTPQGVDLVDTGEELGPATVRAAVDPVGAWGVGYGALDVGAGVEFVHSSRPYVPSLHHFAPGGRRCSAPERTRTPGFRR